MTLEELKEARKEILKKKREASGSIAQILAKLQAETGLIVKDISLTTVKINTADALSNYMIHSVNLETDFN